MMSFARAQPFLRAWIPASAGMSGVPSILGGEPPAHPPVAQNRFGLFGDEETRALPVIALLHQIVIVRKDMADISDEREPRGGFRRGLVEPAAVEGMVDDRAEFVGRHARRHQA